MKHRAVGLPAHIFTVCRFVGIVCQVQIAELVALTVLHPAKAGEERFGLIVGSAVRSAVLDAVVHAARIELGVQRIVGIGFVGADR